MIEKKIFFQFFSFVCCCLFDVLVNDLEIPGTLRHQVPTYNLHSQDLLWVSRSCGYVCFSLFHITWVNWVYSFHILHTCVIKFCFFLQNILYFHHKAVHSCLVKDFFWGKGLSLQTSSSLICKSQLLVIVEYTNPSAIIKSKF